MDEDLYQEQILDHYRYPRHKGKIARANVVYREVNPLCGDELTFYAAVENGTIKSLSFEGQGCAISQASASLLAEFLQGKTVAEALALGENTIYSLLGITISHTRTKCALLSLHTIQKGIRQKGFKEVGLSKKSMTTPAKTRKG